ncbi:protein of unknown function [Bradyrhizobium vignae]|uniref:Uncharacterized protein n=1 Tax=Bradyrhizobium vignae TaxID=1549949 RepID=A0A2U3QA65_9BRAD|nr:protein of unknown function [Bradyrhizobium vignae]
MHELGQVCRRKLLRDIQVIVAFATDCQITDGRRSVSEQKAPGVPRELEIARSIENAVGRLPHRRGSPARLWHGSSLSAAAARLVIMPAQGFDQKMFARTGKTALPALPMACESNERWSAIARCRNFLKSSRPSCTVYWQSSTRRARAARAGDHVVLRPGVLPVIS